MNIAAEMQDKEPAQEIVKTWIRNHPREELDARIEALRLASDWAHHDGNVAKTVERAEAYLKFLRGAAEK